MTRTTLITALIMTLALAAASQIACSKKEKPIPEAPVQKAEAPATASDADTGQSTTAPPPEPPKPAEVRAVVGKIFQTAVTVDAERPYDYVAGDFNGDGSQDIVIVVKPVEANLAEINSQLANWILEDPTKIPQIDTSKTTQQLPPPPAPVVVTKTDTLLAVIHGFGPEGWRSARSIQTYLLKGGVGANMSAAPAAEFRNLAKSLKKSPRLAQGLLTRGDVLKETLNGKSGYLYFSGAKYVWFEP